MYELKPLVNTHFVFFFAVNTLKDTSGFFNMLLLIYGVRLPPSCQKPLKKLQKQNFAS